MRANKTSILLAGLALIVSMLACALTEMTFTNPRMAFDEKGEKVTSIYTPDQQFHVVADLTNAAKGTVVEAKWYTVNVESAEPGPIETQQGNTIIIDRDYWSGYVSFALNNPNGWRPGEYKAELYVDGELKATVNFSVK